MSRTRIPQTVRLELMDGRKGFALVAGTPTVIIFASRAFVRQDDRLLYIEHVAQTIPIIDIDVEQPHQQPTSNQNKGCDKCSHVFPDGKEAHFEGCTVLGKATYWGL